MRVIYASIIPAECPSPSGKLLYISTDLYKQTSKCLTSGSNKLLKCTALQLTNKAVSSFLGLNLRILPKVDSGQANLKAQESAVPVTVRYVDLPPHLYFLY